MITENPKIFFRTDYPHDYQFRFIATLGPSGTSSEFVAQRLSSNVALFPTYEQAEAHIHNSEQKIVLLVANAYQYINRFYISTKTKPVAALFYDTPPYVLASRSKRLQDIPEYPCVSSHRAPAHLIEHILGGPKFTFIEADTTSAAAHMAGESAVDACITTRIACEKERFTLLYESGTIPMLWTIFSKK